MIPCLAILPVKQRQKGKTAHLSKGNISLFPDKSYSFLDRDKENR